MPLLLLPSSTYLYDIINVIIMFFDKQLYTSNYYWNDCVLFYKNAIFMAYHFYKKMLLDYKNDKLKIYKSINPTCKT